MAVETQFNREIFAGDGVTVTFPFSFPIFESEDLTVILTQDDGTEIPLIEGVDYTVSAIRGLYSRGGNVTTKGAYSPLQIDETLTIARILDLTQGVDYQENDTFPAETHEQALDRLTMITQQLDDEITRNLIVPVTDVVPDPLPNAAARANRFLAFDADGNPIAAVGGVTGVPVSAFMETLLDDTDAATAKTTLRITYGTADPTGTPLDGDIYLKHEA